MLLCIHGLQDRTLYKRSQGISWYVLAPLSEMVKPR